MNNFYPPKISLNSLRFFLYRLYSFDCFYQCFGDIRMGGGQNITFEITSRFSLSFYQSPKQDRYKFVLDYRQWKIWFRIIYVRNFCMLNDCLKYQELHMTESMWYGTEFPGTKWWPELWEAVSESHCEMVEGNFPTVILRNPKVSVFDFYS